MKRLILVLLSSGGLCFCQPATNFYYAGKQKIPIEPVTAERLTKGEFGSLANRRFMQMMAYSIEAEAPESKRLYRIGPLLAKLRGSVSVEFRPDTPPGAISELLAGVKGSAERVESSGGILYRITPSKGASPLNESHKLALDPRVYYSEPDLILFSLRTLGMTPVPQPKPRPGNTAPSDPYFPYQWYLARAGLVNPHIENPTAREFWLDLAQRTSSIKVAVIDDGLDVGHPDFDSTRVQYTNLASSCPRASYNPWDRHGTACAGLIAAVTGNGVAISGLSLRAHLLAFRVTCLLGWDAPRVSDPGDFAEAIDRAWRNGADVISLSVGYENGDAGSITDRLTPAIDRALSKGRDGLGTVIVAAAGNVFTSGGSTAVDYPASLASNQRPIIVVSATTADDRFKTINPLSSNDWGSRKGPQVSVAAPGVDLPTTVRFDERGQLAASTVHLFSGTSAAAPLVAGAAALLLAQNPRLTAAQVRERLRATADPVCDPQSPHDRYGAGRLNICRALNQPQSACTTFSSTRP